MKIAGDDGTISAIVTKRIHGKEECRHPLYCNKTPDPFPRPLPTCLVSFIVSSRLAQLTSFIAHGPKNIDDFALTIRNRSIDRSSPFLLPHALQIDANIDNVSINALVSLLLFACL